MRRRPYWLAILTALLIGTVMVGASEPLYNEHADAHHDVAAAMAHAEKAGKNVVLIFGANW